MRNGDLTNQLDEFSAFFEVVVKDSWGGEVEIKKVYLDEKNFKIIIDIEE